MEGHKQPLGVARSPSTVCTVLPVALKSTTDLQVATAELESRFKNLVEAKRHS